MLGYIVGSSSDRTLSEQQAMWGSRLRVRFVCRKHEMMALVTQLGRKYVHIGDTTHDEDSALAAASSSSSPTRPPCSGRPWQRPLADLSVVRPSPGRAADRPRVALN